MEKIDFRSLANKAVRQLTPYQPGKPIEELEREYGVVSSIKLASNENPLGPSPAAISVAKEALLNAHFYPDGNCFTLKQSLANHLSVKPNQLTIGNGSENILELIVKTYLSNEKNAVISQYAFLTISLLLHAYGIETKVVPAQEWGHDIQAMIDVIDHNTRVLFLVNPNNPTGTYTNKEAFSYLMEKVPPHVLVVVDEAYAEYIISSSSYPKTLNYLAHYPNLLITRTFSKAYGLAGLRLGYAISSPEIADMLNRARLPFNVNSIAAHAACAALQDQDHVNKTIEMNQNGMRQLETALQNRELNFISSVCNFITIQMDKHLDIYEKLLYEGVIVRPLTAYDMSNCIRVSIGTSEQNERFLMAIDRLFT